MVVIFGYSLEFWAEMTCGASFSSLASVKKDWEDGFEFR